MDVRSFRNALGSFVTGVTVITTRDDHGIDYGVTANSFNSVSLDPPLVLWSLARSSSSLAAFKNANEFSIHILAAEQTAVSARFAQRGTDKFAGLEFDRSNKGTPLLRDCSARFICRPAYAYDGGDHLIFVGEVLDFQHHATAPLAFHGGDYAVTAGLPQIEPADAESLTHLIQSCYFHLLTPVREERDRQSIGLTEHYILNALHAEEPLDLAGLNAIIGYTGLQAEAAHLAALVHAGLAHDSGGARFALTNEGRECVIRLIGASMVQETKLEQALSKSEIGHLQGLLNRLLDVISGEAPGPVHRHMELLHHIRFGRQ
jgi:3-hydroxy-9,10-secoandrosta-1,3,5(10)-triene-9,17-dione monooxygenase reductase component